MQQVLPGIEAALTIKPDAYKAVREKWPAAVADRICFLLDNAMNVLYVAQQSKDYFVVPDVEIRINMWIESFAPKNQGRAGCLATTDEVLFKLLAEAKLMPRGQSGLLVLPINEVLAQGGKQTYRSIAASSLLIHSPYPLNAGLTRLVTCDKMVPAIKEPNEVMTRMYLVLFMTVNYHLSMRWPVWVAEHHAGVASFPVYVFGFNPVLDVCSSASAFIGARRSLL